jgi:peroxiredoxin
MLKAQYLPWAIVTTLGALAMGLWAAGAFGVTRPPTARAAADSNHLQEKHYVTPRQLADSNAMIHRAVDAVSAEGADGHSVGWGEISGRRPVVLVFIKDGCPCSAEFEPFFQRVERLYRDAVHFAGVIDAEAARARRYAAEQHVPYPVLADPQRRIIGCLRAENGGYFVLLTPQGVIDGLWPGCSAEGMRELGRRIAKLAHLEERPLDLTGMPGPLTTGCPFES